MRRLRSLRRLVWPLLALLCGGGSLWLGWFVGGLSGSAPSVRSFPPRSLVVTVVDVGHGEAAWIKTPGGKFVVIGAGPTGAGGRVVASLRAAGARQIDLLLLPYPYPEAIGGVPELAAAFPIKEAMDSGWSRINRSQDEVRAALARQNVPLQSARTQRHDYDLGGGRLQLLLPAPEPVMQTPAAANNSLVVRVVWGRTAFLFEGGLEEDGEQALLGQGHDLTADWLRVARFGTDGASSLELLRMVSPSFVTLSVGPNNDQLPDPETLSRLNATGATLFRTDTAHKDLVFLSDGETVHAAR